MTADKPDYSTTAGKLEDLRDRYHQAVHASGEAASSLTLGVDDPDKTSHEATNEWSDDGP